MRRVDFEVKFTGKLGDDAEAYELMENVVRVMLRFRVQHFIFQVNSSGMVDVGLDPELSEKDQDSFGHSMRLLFSHLPLTSFEVFLPDEVMARKNLVFEVRP